MLRKLVTTFVPRQIYCSLSVYKILSWDFGQYRTMRRWECLDAGQSPIPWYTYPAIEFLNQIDFSVKSVFEFGSGNSTRYWAKRAEKS